MPIHETEPNDATPFGDVGIDLRGVYVTKRKWLLITKRDEDAACGRELP